MRHAAFTFMLIMVLLTVQPAPSARPFAAPAPVTLVLEARPGYRRRRRNHYPGRVL